MSRYSRSFDDFCTGIKDQKRQLHGVGHFPPRSTGPRKRKETKIFRQGYFSFYAHFKMVTVAIGFFISCTMFYVFRFIKCQALFSSIAIYCLVAIRARSDSQFMLRQFKYLVDYYFKTTMASVRIMPRCQDIHVKRRLFQCLLSKI